MQILKFRKNALNTQGRTLEFNRNNDNYNFIESELFLFTLKIQAYSKTLEKLFFK